MKEIELYSNKNYIIESIYIGGGTPSIFPAEDIEEIINALSSSGEVKDDIEFTIEVNPGTIDREKLERYRALGINRVSIGVQTLRREELTTLGRIHTSEEALCSIQLAKDAGFTNINVDLIYGIPGQTLESWKDTLKRVLDLDITHISIYGLMYEPGTPLYKSLMRGGVNPIPEDTEVEMFNITQDILRDYSFFWYELSNYAREDYECRHNITYWEGKDYLGIGSSSHSLIENTRYSNTPNIEAYIEILSKNKTPRVWIEKLTPLERARELIMLGLRMKRGVSLSNIFNRTGVDVKEIFTKNIEKLISLGLVNYDGDRLTLTEYGRLLGNEVFVEFC